MRRVIFVLAVLMSAVAGTAPGGASPGRNPVPDAAHAEPAAGTLDVLVTLDRPADETLRAALGRFGPWSHTFAHLPVAAVRLRAAALDDLRRLPGVRAVHAEERLPYLLDGAARATGARRVWDDLGVTGAGVTVAVVDSGVDFTHPDLAPAFKANLKMSGFGEPVPVPPLAAPHTDISTGHGTHVAGDVAGRGVASGGKYRGMAPGAGLVGLATGDGPAASAFSVVAAYDWILGHHREYSIRIVNNSYGSSFEPFDPEDPVNVATRAAADAGLLVVFAYGNGGGEMTANSHAAAPWVLGVGAGTDDGLLSDFSSGGIDADVVGTGFAGADVLGETRRPLAMGLYHPAVVATGADVVSTRATGAPFPLLFLRDDIRRPPGEVARYTEASGTSMSAPVAAGVAALVLEGNPTLGPLELQRILQVTARPIAGVPFYRQGYGYVDAMAAVKLARDLGAAPPAQAAGRLEALQSDRDHQVLDALPHPVRTRAWAFSEDPGGGPVVHAVEVPRGIGRLKAISLPLSVAALADGQWMLRVFDASGALVGVAGYVTSTGESIVLDLDLHDLSGSQGGEARRYDELAFGTWTLKLEGPPDTTEAAALVATFEDSPPASLPGMRDAPAAVPPVPLPMLP